MRPAPLSSEPDAAGVLGWHMRLGLLLAVLAHGAFLLWAFLTPEKQPPPRRRYVDMEVVRRKAPEPPPPAPKPPEAPTPTPPQQAQRPASRPLPDLLRPVPREPGKAEPESPAIEVAPQPEPRPGEKPAAPTGPIDLFSKKSLSQALGGPGINAPIPTGPNRLLKDERLDPKKEPEFHLVPERGGGFKYSGSHFTAHIAPDGALTFDDKFPIGFQKGQTGFSFDLTDLVMKGKKQDPYASEKRRFAEYSEKVREELRRKKREGALDAALQALPGELAEIWNSDKAPGVRRRELFEKWVECADDKESSDTTGQRARRMVEDFIRRHLPPGSANAYTEEELRRFALMREGLPQFDPYRGR